MREQYSNPVYQHDFADPFVLKFCGEYWAYCTGIRADGGCFGILRSADLVHWQEVGSAMEPLPGGHTCYWAPEVVYDNGHFYLYYSVGNEERMEIRVAVSKHPAGPFVDSGRRLTSEPFAIDAHVFVDDDGTRYLFYATDFLERERIGTGTVYDRLADPFTLAGERRPAALAQFDWQIYDPRRAEKGHVCWHTVEGPSVLKRKGRYYEMFSGGNWQNTSYGVSYALSDALGRDHEWQQAADGERVLPILRTIPGKVTGPGHNSVVRGPDNRQLYCVYHRWGEEGSGRLLAIDPLDWAGERMLVLGPSTEPQPAPNRPTLAGFEQGWEYQGGHWQVGANELLQLEQAVAQARRPLTAPYFTLELSLRLLESQPDGGFGVALTADGNIILSLRAPGAGGSLLLHCAGQPEQALAIPPGFEPRAYHLLRLEINGSRAQLRLDDGRLQWQGKLAERPDEVRLWTEHAAAAFTGFELSAGWEDRFDDAAASLEEQGWRSSGGQWRLQDQQLQGQADQEGLLVKGAQFADYELVVNAKLIVGQSREGGYGFLPARSPGQAGPRLTLEREGGGWVAAWRSGESSGRLPLPQGFDPEADQQFRFRKLGGRLLLQWESQALGEIPVQAGPTGIGLLVSHGRAAFEMVRLTVLPSDV